VKPDVDLPTGGHLTDDELFALAVPATGAPEPLPVHLSGCLTCSRALADWKSALRDVGGRDEEVLARRSAEEWRAVEEGTLAAIRRAGPAGRGRSRNLTWAVAAAASLLLFALLVGNRERSAPIAFDDTAGLSLQDRADDALLRDVDRLASGEETGSGWSSLAPDPSESSSARPELPQEKS
jgi:hypothetical protein